MIYYILYLLNFISVEFYIYYPIKIFYSKVLIFIQLFYLFVKFLSSFTIFKIKLDTSKLGINYVLILIYNNLCLAQHIIKTCYNKYFCKVKRFKYWYKI